LGGGKWYRGERRGPYLLKKGRATKKRTRLSLKKKKKKKKRRGSRRGGGVLFHILKGVVRERYTKKGVPPFSKKKKKRFPHPKGPSGKKSFFFGRGEKRRLFQKKKGGKGRNISLGKERLRNVAGEKNEKNKTLPFF